MFNSRKECDLMIEKTGNLCNINLIVQFNFRSVLSFYGKSYIYTLSSSLWHHSNEKREGERGRENLLVERNNLMCTYKSGKKKMTESATQKRERERKNKRNNHRS